MDIEKFIIEREYNFKIESWFSTLWKALFERVDIIITPEIYKFLFNTENKIKFITDAPSEDILNCCYEMYLKILLKHKIPYTVLSDKKQPQLLLGIQYFKESLLYTDKKINNELYFALEDISIDYRKYLYEEEIKELKIAFQNKLQNIKKKYNNLMDILIKQHTLEANQIFYIATTKKYAEQNIFKLGGLENKNNLELNSQSKDDNDFYYIALYLTHDYLLILTYMSSYLPNFQLPNKKNMYKIDFHDLLDIVDNIIKETMLSMTYFNNIYPSLIDNILKTRDIKETKMIRNESMVSILNEETNKTTLI